MEEPQTSTFQNIAKGDTHQIGDETGLIQVLTKNSIISVFKISPNSCDFDPVSYRFVLKPQMLQFFKTRSHAVSQR